MTVTYSDQTLALAVRWVIATMNPPVVPVTRLSTEAASGDRTIQVEPLLTGDGRPRFIPGGWVVFDDGQGEETLDIKAVSEDGTTITLSFSGMGYDGLQMTHDAGARIYTNLDTDAALEIVTPLALGDPLISVMAVHEEDQQQTMAPSGFAADEALYSVHVEYFRRLSVTPGQAIAPNRWAKRQQEGARRDLNAIKAALRGNRALESDYLPPQSLGPPPGPWLVSDWTRLTREVNTHVFASVLEISLRGNNLT